MGTVLSPFHLPQTERTPTPVLPRHFVGWAAVAWLLVVAAFPAYWGKLNDILTTNAEQLGVGAVAVGAAVVLVWQAHFRRKDRSLLLNAVAVLAADVALFGILFGLAMLGQAFS